MKLSLFAAAILAGTMAVPSLAAASERAIATTDVNLRAGPSTDYPVVDVVGSGDAVRVFGCLETRSWCDVRYHGQRGWMSANYIAYAVRRGRDRAFDPYSAPVITFSVDGYWGDHYRGRDFYRQRDRYDRRHRDDWGDRRGRRHDRFDDRDDRRPGWGRGSEWRDRRPDWRDRGPDRRGDRRPDWRDRDGRGPDWRDRRPDRGDDRFRRGRDDDRGGRGDRDRRGAEGRDRGDGKPLIRLPFGMKPND
ncbi:SH3 domain-containing protein [Jiella marina]|uniref:SH3 domain-containing protein n=1 Tax=Jiella sp. LLJ827 TaxID=2917712 RepID=UPI0026ECD890|nr:SH3 domain-containing protein [Jiella sp. LLJ827]